METDTADEKTGHASVQLGGRSSFISDPGATFSWGKLSDFHKERKRSKKKERSEGEGRWKLPQPWKSDKDAFGGIFLMISTAAWKSLRGGPRRLSHSSHRPGGDQQQNRTFHLLPKPDIIKSYRQILRPRGSDGNNFALEVDFLG